jgi:hypothetical protein
MRVVVSACDSIVAAQKTASCGSPRLTHPRPRGAGTEVAP